jgi:hypothetical protein
LATPPLDAFAHRVAADFGDQVENAADFGTLSELSKSLPEVAKRFSKRQHQVHKKGWFLPKKEKRECWTKLI